MRSAVALCRRRPPQSGLFTDAEIAALDAARATADAARAAKHAADQSVVDELDARVRALAVALAGVGLREREAQLVALRRAAELRQTTAIDRAESTTLDTIAPPVATDAVQQAAARRAQREAIVAAGTSVDRLVGAGPADNGLYAVGALQIGTIDDLFDLDALAAHDDAVLTAARRRPLAAAYLRGDGERDRPFKYDRVVLRDVISTLRAVSSGLEWLDARLQVQK